MLARLFASNSEPQVYFQLRTFHDLWKAMLAAYKDYIKFYSAFTNIHLNTIKPVAIPLFGIALKATYEDAIRNSVQKTLEMLLESTMHDNNSGQIWVTSIPELTVVL